MIRRVPRRLGLSVVEAPQPPWMPTNRYEPQQLRANRRGVRLVSAAVRHDG
jgi:hypothetical protein